ncbi:MAG: hypothetical protein KIG40_07510, partial [Bacteroidaceae bacterium]|nr:hypothetical protein [Bacteroidaceae bacterium]
MKRRFHTLQEKSCEVFCFYHDTRTDFSSHFPQNHKPFRTHEKSISCAFPSHWISDVYKGAKIQAIYFKIQG